MANSHLVIEGLDFKVDEFMLQEYFKKYGQISYVEVKVDEETQKPLGYADIKLVNPAIYVKIFNDAPHKINGRLCSIKIKKDEYNS